MPLQCKLKSANVNFNDFYGKLKRIHSQNLFTLNIKLYDTEVNSFYFKSELPYVSKPISGFTLETLGDNFGYHGSVFQRPSIKILNTDLNENYNDEYSVDFNENAKFKELSFTADVVNDSKAFLLYDELLKKKMTVDDKELLDRCGRRDESFEEEIEYMVKIKENYEEFYNY